LLEAKSKIKPNKKLKKIRKLKKVEKKMKKYQIVASKKNKFFIDKNIKSYIVFVV
jgi:hypothetical protein